MLFQFLSALPHLYFFRILRNLSNLYMWTFFGKYIFLLLYIILCWLYFFNSDGNILRRPPFQILLKSFRMWCTLMCFKYLFKLEHHNILASVTISLALFMLFRPSEWYQEISFQEVLIPTLIRSSVSEISSFMLSSIYPFHQIHFLEVKSTFLQAVLFSQNSKWWTAESRKTLSGTAFGILLFQRMIIFRVIIQSKFSLQQQDLKLYLQVKWPSK